MLLGRSVVRIMEASFAELTYMNLAHQFHSCEKEVARTGVFNQLTTSRQTSAVNRNGVANA